MILWQSPWAFFLFIPLTAIVVFYYLNRRRKTPTFKFSTLSVVRSVSPGLRARLIWLPQILATVGLALAIFALARPQRADVKVKKNVEGIDIVVALDVSDSMLIEDMQPVNRLESSKNTIKNFIEGRLSDRIGLVVFSGESFTRVPLTLDYPLLLKSLSDVKTTRNIKMGTAIGVALANSVARLKESTAKTRVIIFLTDGENNSGTIDPETALDIAEGYGIRIYTIGVGRDGQTRIPIYSQDPFGNRIKRYQPFYSKVNEDLLQRLAKRTGGRYYRAESTQSLEGVFSEIDSLEKTKIDKNQYTEYAELFPQYLWWALSCYVLSMILSGTVFRRVP